MQCGIEGTMLHLQEIVRGPLNMLSDLVPMSSSIKKSPQDEHVQRALKKSVSFFHGRHSTFNLLAMVDTRPPIVKDVVSPWRFPRIADYPRRAAPSIASGLSRSSVGYGACRSRLAIVGFPKPII